jgi:uncharacterized protein YkuJ
MISEPIVFISNQQTREGKLDGYKQYYRQVAELTKENKPGTLGHLAYASVEGTEVSIVHIFPDTECMELHMVGVDSLANKAFEFMEITSIEIYGRPSDKVLGILMQIAGSGVALHLKSQSIGGYIRSNQDKRCDRTTNRRKSCLGPPFNGL